MARKSTPNDEIQALVAQFTDQLTVCVKQSALQQLQAVLGTPTTNGGVRRGRKARVVRVGRARRGGKRTPEQVEKMAGRLIVFIKQKPGQRGEQIAKALKTDVKSMRLPMQTLLAKKKVKTKGQRRGMQYFVA